MTATARPARQQIWSSRARLRILRRCAGMAELVDAPDSKFGSLRGVRVRIPLPAPRPLYPPYSELLPSA